MSIFGTRFSRELKLLPGALSKIDKTTYRTILKYVLTTLEGGVNRRSLDETLGESAVDSDIIAAVVGGLFSLLKSLFRAEANSLKPEVLQLELRDLKLSEDVISDVMKIIANQRSLTLYNGNFKAVKFPAVEKFNWRVDVSISTSSLCRVLEPNVVCEMILNNGEIKHFEMPMKTFHNLRCQVATVLQEMHHIEERDMA
ncbi:COMM domain containing 5 [Chamberlinius hualienensis]